MADLPQLKFSDLTPVTALALADTFAVLQGGANKSASVSDIITATYANTDVLSSQDTLTDTMVSVLRNGSANEKTTLSVLRAYVQDSSKPSIKNLTIVNNAGSPTDTIDIDFDELQIGTLKETSYTGQSITLASDLDTGSASNSTNYYIHIFAGVGQTTVAKFSLSRTAPTLGAYTEFICVGSTRTDVAGVLPFKTQKDRRVRIPLTTVVNSVTDTVDTLIDLSAAIALGMTTCVSGIVFRNGVLNATGIQIKNETTFAAGVQVFRSDGASNYQTGFSMDLISDNLYYVYESAVTTETFGLAITGYELNI